MWNNLLVAAEPTIIAVFGAIIAALGGWITTVITAHFGAKTAMIASTAYQMAADSAAGWLKTYLDSKSGAAGEATATALTPASPAVQAAVGYMKDAFPEAVAKIAATSRAPLGDTDIAADILGAFGKLLPGPIGVIAGVAATVVKPKPKK